VREHLRGLQERTELMNTGANCSVGSLPDCWNFEAIRVMFECNNKPIINRQTQTRMLYSIIPSFIELHVSACIRVIIRQFKQPSHFRLYIDVTCEHSIHVHWQYFINFRSFFHHEFHFFFLSTVSIFFRLGKWSKGQPTDWTPLDMWNGKRNFDLLFKNFCED